jgi:plastocyanin
MMFFKGIFGRAAACGLLFAAASSGAWAFSANVTVTDADAKAVSDAVVYAEAAGGQTLPKLLKPAAIEQKNREFWPLVTVIQTGSTIAFPNHDKLRHQVYSFSPAKVFELKLYSGNSAPPPRVLFDKVGTVVVGCNIHDEMIAYVQVVNTPYFGKTDAAGNVRLDNLPDGKYVLKTWHYAMPSGVNAPEQQLIVQGANANLAIKLNTRIATE